MATQTPASKGEPRVSPEKGPQVTWFRSRRYWVGLSVVLLVIVGAVATTAALRHGNADPTVLPLSGRIEADETHIGVRMPARVKSVLVKEGDLVRKGELILLLDDQDVIAKKNEASDALAAAKESKRAAYARLASLKSEGARLQAASRSFMGRLFGGKKKAQQQGQDLRLQASEVQAQIRAAGDEVARAQASLDEVSANLSYFHITSPIDGVCSTRSVQPGDMVSPGQVLLTLADLNSVYLKGFIPEGSIGQVKINQAAKVFLDSSPNTPLSARVAAIDSEASFTPENIYFKQDRVKQVFGMKLAIDNRGGLAKPGLPADAQIILAQQEKSK